MVKAFLELEPDVRVVLQQLAHPEKLTVFQLDELVTRLVASEDFAELPVEIQTPVEFIMQGLVGIADLKDRVAALGNATQKYLRSPRDVPKRVGAGSRD